MTDRIRVFNLAVSSNTGKAIFYQADVSGWSSFFKSRGCENGKPVQINTINISTFCKNYEIKKIDFLKIDIEGAEYNVILGDPDLFNLSIREIVIEVDRNPRDERYKFDELINYLKKHYSFVKVDKGDYPLVHCRERKL